MRLWKLGIIKKKQVHVLEHKIVNIKQRVVALIRNPFTGDNVNVGMNVEMLIEESKKRKMVHLYMRNENEKYSSVETICNACVIGCFLARNRVIILQNDGIVV